MKKQKSSINTTTLLSNQTNQKQDYSASKVALDICMAEYRRMVDEALECLEWHRSLIQYALAIIAGAATAIGLFPNVPEIYLIASVLLSVIAWIFAEQSVKQLTYHQYIIHKLAPLVNSLISTIDPQTEDANKNLKNLLGFDLYFRAGNFRSFVSGFFGIGKFLVALFPGLGFAIAYFYVVPKDFINWTGQQKIFYFIVLVLSILPLFFGLPAALYYFLRYRHEGE